MIEGLKIFRQGKVRDVYDLGDKLLMVATDRISCFDVILPTLIPDKGKILTEVSLFWFSFLKDTVKNHLFSAKASDLFETISGSDQEYLQGRIMIVKKCKVVPFECVVRGYLSGSGWKEYQKSQSVCGIKLPEGLKESSKLSEPIFTPATKAEVGHDENVSFEYMRSKIDPTLADQIKQLSLDIYRKAADYADKKGIIIADTKFEFGLDGDELILIDEVLTPDSSRFWPKSEYQPGRPQSSFDKQFVRDYLETLDWNKTPPGPVLPQEIVKKTQSKYREALEALTNR
ncbi:MAG: phosphoribosylaminoimidazolesuccinocarboxamide synthase [Candidatus Omnitrophica bacterium]|nr:phosphoribosylaminoimidazolesuccinocarboxamide synthase [Candidatus Omnitrophota bacterium]